MKVTKVAVIGLGHFGASLCERLSRAGIEVLGIDENEERVREVEAYCSQPVIMDSTDLKGLKNLGLHEMDAVVVAIGEDFEASILTTAHLQELGVKRLIARTMNKVQKRVISLMGIKEQILPERESAINLAYRISLGAGRSFIEIGNDHGFLETVVPDKLVGLSLKDAQLREKYQLNLVTIKRPEVDGELKVIGTPSSDEVFQRDDVLVIFAGRDHIKDFL